MAQECRFRLLPGHMLQCVSSFVEFFIVTEQVLQNTLMKTSKGQGTAKQRILGYRSQTLFITLLAFNGGEIE